MAYIEISKTECVGDSLSSINTNFENLDTTVTTLSAQYLNKNNNLSEIVDKDAARANLNIPTYSTIGQAKAMLLFDGALATYTASGLIIDSKPAGQAYMTVNLVNHGFPSGIFTYFTFNSTANSLANGYYEISSVTDNTLTFKLTNATAIAAAISGRTCNIRKGMTIIASENVKFVLKYATGQYILFYINELDRVGIFTGGAGYGSNSVIHVGSFSSAWLSTTKWIPFMTFHQGTGYEDYAHTSVVVF